MEGVELANAFYVRKVDGKFNYYVYMQNLLATSTTIDMFSEPIFVEVLQHVNVAGVQLTPSGGDGSVRTKRIWVNWRYEVYELYWVYITISSNGRLVTPMISYVFYCRIQYRGRLDRHMPIF